jgi:hypothetical protein
MFPVPRDGAGHIPPPTWGQAHPENSPAWLWGQGSPAAIAPFTTVNKGSVYSQVDASDDNPNLWVKIDEGGDAADWVHVGDTGILVVTSSLFDISGTSSEQVVFNAVTASEILEVGLIWEEATDGAGADAEDITIGTTTGGAEIVAATKFGLSQASGDYQALTIADGDLAAGDSVFAHHDLVAEAGTFRVQLKIRVEA